MNSRSFSFLLRLWQAGAPDSQEWHASLEDSHTHKLTGFNNLEALFDFIRERTESNGVEDFLEFSERNKAKKKK